MSTDYTEFESKMKKTASVLTEQYDSVRAGKANPAVLDPPPSARSRPFPAPTRARCSSSRGTHPCSRALKRPSWRPIWA